MKKAMRAALVPLAMMVPVGGAMAQDDLVGRLLAKADELSRNDGYRPTGWTRSGDLKQGERAELAVKLTGGKSYKLVGACDGDCKDMDIQIVDLNGQEVDRDELDDDFPIVHVPQSGNYTVRVIMASCSASPCAYGVRAYAK